MEFATENGKERAKDKAKDREREILYFKSKK